MNYYHPPHHGFTIIEVLIAMVLFSIALLSFEKTHGMAIAWSEQNGLQSLALQQIKNMAFILSLKPANFDEMKEHWNQENRQLLPKGKGEIIHLGEHNTQVRIFWQAYSFAIWQCQEPRRPQVSCLELTLWA
jgi:prepilin-type N-terminal cleavage/methylation domain-containing protein